MIVLRDANQIRITDAAQVAAVFRDLLALEDAIARDTEHYFVMHLDARHTVKLVELVSIGVLYVGSAGTEQGNLPAPDTPGHHQQSRPAGRLQRRS